MGILIGAFVSCLLSGVFPWIAGEVVVLGAAILLPPEALPALVLFSSAGQVIGKLAVYGIARWAPHQLPEGGRRVLDRASSLGRSRKAMSVTILTSAAVSLPPFYLTTLACGTVGVPVKVFAAAGFGGTLLRYGAVAWSATFISAGLG